MDLRAPDANADLRRVGEQVAKELQLTFAGAGFWLNIYGADPRAGRAYVAIAPIRADEATRLIERLRELGLGQDQAASPLPLGALAVDMKRDRVGVMMGTLGNRVFLRPLEGGREWEAAPDDVRAAGAAEELRAKVAEVNACRKGMP